MKLDDISEENKKETELVKGTNCSNCSFTKGSKPVEIKKDELNSQGGLDPINDNEMNLAQDGDLITLPGKAKAKIKMMCNHPKINQYVNERMCCAYWDNPGVYRPFGKKVVGK